MLIAMDELLTRGVDEIINSDELAKLLKAKKKLRLKLGVDPSSPDIHLGHAVVLRKLRQLQEMGHTVIFLIGDATARIGDPSGRNKTRPVLSEQDIHSNAQTYLDQVGKIIDVKSAEIRRNSEWLDKLSFGDLVALSANFTVAQLIERDDFKKRLDSGSELGLHELLYPVMQAYDSVMLEADVEFGGSDQRFNMLAGRSLQKKMGQVPQQVFMTKLLVGTDGSQKMSKSLGNYIGITDEPGDMYGKVMSIPDSLIPEYYELATDIASEAIEQLVKTLAEGANPRDAKASLAREIVSIYHGEKTALAAAERFGSGDYARPQVVTDSRFKHPLEVQVQAQLPKLLTELGITTSHSDARRLIEQGGVKINNQPLNPDSVTLKSGDTISIGKRQLYTIEA